MQDKIDMLLGYFTACLGFLVQQDWMAIGATVLLIARLIQDLPRAYCVIKRLTNGKSNK